MFLKFLENFVRQGSVLSCGEILQIISKMTLLFSFFIINVKAQSKDIRLEIVKSTVATQKEAGFDFLGNHQKIIFRVVNHSQNPIILLGEKDEDGFEPENDILTFHFDTGKWLYISGDKKTRELDSLSSEETETYLLKAGKSVKFERLLNYSCIVKKYKMVVFFKIEGEELFQELTSTEITLQDTKDNCR